MTNSPFSEGPIFGYLFFSSPKRRCIAGQRFFVIHTLFVLKREIYIYIGVSLYLFHSHSTRHTSTTFYKSYTGRRYYKIQFNPNYCIENVSLCVRVDCMVSMAIYIYIYRFNGFLPLYSWTTFPLGNTEKKNTLLKGTHYYARHFRIPFHVYYFEILLPLHKNNIL